MRTTDGRFLAVNRVFQDRHGVSEEQVVWTLGEAIFTSESLARFGRDDWTVARRLVGMSFVEGDDRDERLFVRTEKRPVVAGSGTVAAIAGFVNWVAPPVRQVREDPALPEWLSGAYQRIVAGYAEPLVLADEARRLRVREYELSRSFKRAFGRSPKRLLHELRAYSAAYRMETSGIELADLAAEAGFADQSHLNRVFRKVFGCPPGRYRAERSPAAGACKNVQDRRFPTAPHCAQLG